MKRTKKGFTLAELLVVVAIIAVLVAIAIPIFNGSQAKAEEAVEVANARATYAEGMVAVADGSYDLKAATPPEIERVYGGKTYTFTYSGTTWTVTVDGGINTSYTNADSGKDFSEVTIDGKAG